MKILLLGLLTLSLALNIFLWSRLSSQSKQLKLAQANASEMDELRRQNEELQIKSRKAPDSASADMHELYQLRNQVGQLRKQVGEVASLRTQAAEAAQLRARLDTATRDLAEAEGNLAEIAKMSPEELQQLKYEAHKLACINNLKQIGIAAQIWANDHQNIFPPDFISMKEEINTPNVLFCPGDSAAIRVKEWSQLNPASISYLFMNPNGNRNNDSQKMLMKCQIHGHIGYGDGSVLRSDLR